MRFPYKLYIEVSAGGGYDDDGFKIPASKEWIFHSICRDKPNNSGALVNTESGDFSNFSSLIYMPKNIPEIKPNTKIQVRDIAGNVRLNSTSIRFHSSQLNSRLWV